MKKTSFKNILRSGALMLLALTLLLTSCTGGVTTPTADKTPAATTEATPSLTPTLTPEATKTPEITTDPVEMNVFAMNGPTGMGMAALIHKANEGKTYDKYNFTLAASADEKLADLIAGKFDIASIPTNLAAVLDQKAGGIYKVMAVNTLGVLYIVDNTGSVKSLEDLRGKTVYATGAGLVPQFALEYVLEASGLEVGKDVTVEYLAKADDVGKMVISGDAEIAMLPQPYVTSVLSQAKNAKIALDITEEWDKVSNGESQLMTGCVVVKESFAKENANAVYRFLAEYSASVHFTNENPKEASVYIEEAGIVAKAALAEKAIPKCNIVYISAENLETSLMGFYKVLFEIEPKSLGGSMPTTELIGIDLSEYVVGS